MLRNCPDQVSCLLITNTEYSSHIDFDLFAYQQRVPISHFSSSLLAMSTHGSPIPLEQMSGEQAYSSTSTSPGPPASLMISPPSPDSEPGQDGLLSRFVNDTSTRPSSKPVKIRSQEVNTTYPQSRLPHLPMNGLQLPKQLSTAQPACNTHRVRSQPETHYQPLRRREDIMRWPQMPPRPVTELAFATSTHHDSDCCLFDDPPVAMPDSLQGAFSRGVTTCLHLLRDIILGPQSDAVFQSYGYERGQDHV